MRPKLIRRRQRFPRNRICLSDTPRSRLFIGPRLHSSSNHPREINVDERTRELQLDPRKVHPEGRRRSMIISRTEARRIRRIPPVHSRICAPDALRMRSPRIGLAYLPPGKASSFSTLSSHSSLFFLRMLSFERSLSLSLLFVRSALRVPRFPAEKLLKNCAIHRFVRCRYRAAALCCSPLFLEFPARNF